jgi:hypothetical protein
VTLDRQIGNAPVPDQAQAAGHVARGPVPDQAVVGLGVVDVDFATARAVLLAFVPELPAVHVIPQTLRALDATGICTDRHLEIVRKNVADGR